MPHIEPRTQQLPAPHPPVDMHSKTSPTDEEVMQMAEWYADRKFGAFAVESDSLDLTFNFWAKK